MKKILSILPAAVLGTALIICPVSAQAEEASSETSESESMSTEESAYPVTIDNMNMQTTYEAAPERIVSLSYAETEILVALGLQDKIVGIAEADNTSDVVSEEYRDIVSQLQVIAAMEDGGVPTLEVVLSQTPDFVYGTVYSFNASYGVGAAEDFQNNGINIYASTGTYKYPTTIEDTYQDILNIGKIFNVSDRAEEIVGEMKEKISDITQKVSDAGTTTFFIYDSGDSAAYTYSEGSYESSLIELAGGTNVLDADSIEGGSGGVGWEILVQADPDFIVINDYGGVSGVSTSDEKIAMLKSLPELQDLKAIQNDSFVVIPLEQIGFGCLQNVTAIQTVAETFYPEQFN